MPNLKLITALILGLLLGWYLHYFHAERVRLAVFEDLYALKEENRTYRIRSEVCEEELEDAIIKRELGVYALMEYKNIVKYDIRTFCE